LKGTVVQIITTGMEQQQQQSQSHSQSKSHELNGQWGTVVEFIVCV
jgi:hypothetical protein